MLRRFYVTVKRSSQVINEIWLNIPLEEDHEDRIMEELEELGFERTLDGPCVVTFTRVSSKGRRTTPPTQKEIRERGDYPDSWPSGGFRVTPTPVYRPITYPTRTSVMEFLSSGELKRILGI